MTEKHEENYGVLEPANVTKRDVEEIASHICRGFNFRPGDDINGLVHKFGGEVKYLGMDEWMKTLDSDDGAINVSGRGDFTISVSRFTAPTRNRFTIAHELGHYILHSKLGQKRIKVARSGIDERIEWEANWFAGSILMPEEQFKEMARKEPDRYYLANYFGVSPQAVDIGKKHFGIES